MSAPARINGKIAPWLEAAVETVTSELRGHGISVSNAGARIRAGESLYRIAVEADCLISQILLAGRATEAQVSKKILEQYSHVA
jgi:hypothetical protein